MKKKITLAVTGCLGRMGQQIIKSAYLDKNFSIVTLTENKVSKKKIKGILIETNSKNPLLKQTLL